MESVGYILLCLNCERWVESPKKTNTCPNCGKAAIKRIYEHFRRPTESAYIYFHLCAACKVQFDTDKENEGVCFRCNGPAENTGYSISCGRVREAPEPFFSRIAYKLRELLP